MLLLRFLLLGSFVLIVRSLTCRYQKCSYFGDPHLIAYGSSNQYWCKKSGWELLNGNAYVNVYVKVGNSPYLITDYAITFPAANPCVLFDSTSIPLSPATTCGAATPVTTSIIVAGSHWMHIHEKQCIMVEVIKRWGYFDIHVYQSSSLVGSTKGVCTQKNCSLEGSWPNPKPVIVDICTIFVAHAQRNALAEVGATILKVAKISCITDIQVTFNVQFAVQSVDIILRQSVLKQLKGDARVDQGLFRKLDGAAKTAIANGISDANQVIRRSNDICDAKTGLCLRPFEETPTSQTSSVSSSPLSSSSTSSGPIVLNNPTAILANKN